MSDQKQKLKIDYSKAPKTPEAKAHFEHWCMAEGCHCWGDFGLAGPQGKGQIWLCAAHRAQYLNELEEKKQKEQAKCLPLPVKDDPDQGGLF
ncbi:hypothetical protein [Cohaesibacter marisflavi]|uniref:hypothetical protein n=1 Tax=Cohaesibacter marisflavi TaxID=655353 RepID=UPI0029C82C08|nr:hypothetical protein [Cohaesibacter marisflavi]